MPTKLDKVSDQVETLIDRNMSEKLPLRNIVRNKIAGLHRLTQLIRVTSNWPTIWKHRRETNRLPTLHLRNGIALHHGPYDSPLLLLDEVFVKHWYDLADTPPPNAIMLDIGANIGAVSLYWAARSSSLKIHGYEPNPAAFQTLQNNLEKNGLKQRMTVFPEAVGRDRGTLSLWVDVPTDLSTGYLEQSPCDGGKRIDVPVVGIDEIWERMKNQPIWLLKVDTEGAEVDILEGASRAFLGAVKNAIVEYHDNIYPGSLVRCRRVLEGAGFNCRVLTHGLEGIIYAERPHSD